MKYKELARLTIDIPSKLRKRLKIYAASHSESMKNVICRALEKLMKGE